MAILPSPSRTLLISSLPRSRFMRAPVCVCHVIAAYHRRRKYRGLEMSDVAQGFDYVVVGGGTAGCALAARLSEHSSRTVCLLEAGGSGKSLFINVPGAIVMAQRAASLNWRFQSVSQPHLN